MPTVDNDDSFNDIDIAYVHYLYLLIVNASVAIASQELLSTVNGAKKLQFQIKQFLYQICDSINGIICLNTI